MATRRVLYPRLRSQPAPKRISERQTTRPILLSTYQAKNSEKSSLKSELKAISPALNIRLRVQFCSSNTSSVEIFTPRQER